MKQTEVARAGLPRVRWPVFLRTPVAITGLICCVVPLSVAFLGPLVGGDGATSSSGLPGAPPGDGHLLGTDYLGRDVLSRTFQGGLSVVVVGFLASALGYSGGFLIGVSAGYTKTALDAVLMRTVDVILAFPALVVLLLAVNSLGTSWPVLLVAVSLIQVPGIARLVRSVTKVARTSGYVESAMARGERSASVVIREILPNITPVILADFGLRFGQAILLVASMNFLGLGLQPPAADWGLMIAENRGIFSLNPAATLVPASFLGLLMVGINLVADAFSASLGVSARAGLAAGLPVRLPSRERSARGITSSEWNIAPSAPESESRAS